jgi:8-oxo-dGTP diphosphatase
LPIRSGRATGGRYQPGVASSINTLADVHPAAARLLERVHRAALVLYRVSPMPLRRLIIRAVAPTYVVGAVVVLRRGDGSVLLVRQRHTGAWALPGGLLRRGEAAADGAAREVAEEVGIDLEPSRLGSPIPILDAFRRSVDLVYFHDQPLGQPPSRNDPTEVTSVGWFRPQELPELTLPTRGIVSRVDLAAGHPIGG